MSNLKVLLKYSLINGLGINKLFKKKKARSTIGFIGSIILIYLLVFAFLTLYMFLFVQLFRDGGNPELIFLMGITLSTFLIFFGTLSKANAYIFRTKDFDILSSLPIKTKDIVIVKILSLYIINLLYAFTIMFSMEIAYFSLCGFSFLPALIYFLLIFIVPLFPIAFGSLIAYGLGYIPLKQKVKNYLSTFLYMAFTIAFLTSYFLMMSGDVENMNEQMTKMYTIYGNAYIFGKWAFLGMLGDYLYLLIFVGISIVSIVLFVLIVSANFVKYNSMAKVEVNKNYSLSDEKYQSNSSEVKTLFKKEWQIYVGLPMYMMNTIIGPILSIIGTVIFCLQLDGIYYVFAESSLTNAEISNILMLLVDLMLIFCVSLTSTTSSSISLEGKSFWIIKSAPVQTKSVFWAKVLLNIIITVPFIIVDFIIAQIFIKANVLVFIVALIIPVLYALGMSLLGLLFNTMYQKFEYTNATQVVKNSIPVMLNVLVSFAICILVFVSGIFSFLYLGFTFTILIQLLIGIIFFIVSYLLLMKVGTKKYEKIQA